MASFDFAKLEVVVLEIKIFVKLAMNFITLVFLLLKHFKLVFANSLKNLVFKRIICFQGFFIPFTDSSLIIIIEQN